MAKKMTMKYWDALSEDSRYRALRKVFSQFSDSINHDYAKRKAKDISSPMWKVIQSHVKQTDDDHYKTYIDRTFIP